MIIITVNKIRGKMARERYSSRREAIYEAVRAVKCHPDAEWVYRTVRRDIPNISLGTVYRNLRALSACGKLNTLETESGIIHYDADLSCHAHFVCRKCGAIEDLCSYGGGIELSSSGYEVEHVKTVAYGVCAKCSGKTPS